MSMKQIACVTAILMLSVFSERAGATEDRGLSAELRSVVEQNLAAYNREDAAGAMNFIHTKSPEYSATQGALPGQFEVLDARTELVGFHYIGHDNEFAVARVKLKTVDQSEEPFSANVIDTITVFHQEDGVWKYWSDHILGVELLQ
jgi:hypothetical protein